MYVGKRIPYLDLFYTAGIGLQFILNPGESSGAVTGVSRQLKKAYGTVSYAV